MHKAFIGLFALGLVAAAPLAQAAEKIGVVDLGSVLAKSDAGKSVEATLKAAGKQHQQDLEQKQDALKKEQGALQKNASVETKAAQEQAQQKFQADVQAYQKWVQDTQQDFSQQQQKLLQPLQNALGGVIKSYAQRNGYDLILDKGAAIYNGDSLDLTDEILRDFNAAEAGSSSK